MFKVYYEIILTNTMLQLSLIISTLFSSCCALYAKTSSVIELNGDNFDKLVINSDEIWIVQYFAPWCNHCKNFATEYEKTANILKGLIKVGAVNADKFKTFGDRFNLKSYPAIKIFGLDKQKPIDYSDERECKGLVDAAILAIHETIDFKLNNEKLTKNKKLNYVITLNDENFDELVLKSKEMWLIQFYAPWCQHCKSFAPIWNTVAEQLDGKVQCGALDATQNKKTADAYKIANFPTVKYFGPHKSSKKNIVEYDGGRTSADIVNWGLERYFENAPDPEIVQIINPEIFQKACVEKPLCVVAVLPEILDCQAGCRYEYLSIIADLSRKYKKKLWGWTWSEAITQAELESSLDIGGFGYPAMAVINFEKKKFSLMKGSFSLSGIDEFLKEISFGRGTTSSIKNGNVPEIAVVKPWNGYDDAGVADEEKNYEFMDFMNDKDEL